MTKYDFYSDKFIQEGWVCPRCGRVNAPWLPNCSCGSNETVVTTDNTSPSNTAWSIAESPHIKVEWTNKDNLNKGEWTNKDNLNDETITFLVEKFF